jgi:hypothetical protein
MHDSKALNSGGEYSAKQPKSVSTRRISMPEENERRKIVKNSARVIQLTSCSIEHCVRTDCGH